MRRVRYIFDFSDSEIKELFSSVEMDVDKDQIINWMKKEEDEGFTTLYDKELATFLNGLIVLKRGKKDGEIPIAEKKTNNNIVFRKLRIALNLKDTDILEIMDLANFKMSKHELSAFFRKPNQSQYRPCKDQILRNFLQGLQMKLRG